MNIEEVRDFCLSLPGVTEDMPYGPDVLVFRIEGKIFMHISLDRVPTPIALKLPPAMGADLRDRYEDVTPAWHMNKVHWSDIVISSFSDSQLQEWMREAYLLVRSKLPKVLRAKYEGGE